MPGAPIASGKRVTLRAVEREDVPFLQRAGATPEIRYPLGNPVTNREEHEISDGKGADEFLVCLEGADADSGRPSGIAPVRLHVRGAFGEDTAILSRTGPTRLP